MIRLELNTSDSAVVTLAFISGNESEPLLGLRGQVREAVGRFFSSSLSVACVPVAKRRAPLFRRGEAFKPPPLSVFLSVDLLPPSPARSLLRDVPLELFPRQSSTLRALFRGSAGSRVWITGRGFRS